MLSRYNLSQTKDGYNFTTDFGVIYNLYFTEYYLRDAVGEDIKIQSFGFSTEPPQIRNKRTIYKYDEKVKNTIAHAIAEYINVSNDTGLLYVCATDNGYARHRKIVFNQWYSQIDNPFIEKFDCTPAHAKAGFYTSMLIRVDNPMREYYVEAFYRSMDEYFN